MESGLDGAKAKKRSQYDDIDRIMQKPYLRTNNREVVPGRAERGQGESGSFSPAPGTVAGDDSRTRGWRRSRKEPGSHAALPGRARSTAGTGRGPGLGRVPSEWAPMCSAEGVIDQVKVLSCRRGTPGFHLVAQGGHHSQPRRTK